MSDEQPIPLSKIKLISVPLYTYEQTILQKNGTLSVGNVVTHLPLEDWAEMKGYKIQHFAGRRYATANEKTALVVRNLRGGVPDSKRTMIGMSPIRDSVPPSSKRCRTVIGIPMPEVPRDTIRPIAIKMIGQGE